MCNEIEKTSEIVFSDEQIKEIENLAAANYTINQLAMYLDISPATLQREYENTESQFRYHYFRGKLIINAEIDKRAADLAKTGNITAIQIIKKSQQETLLNNLKNELFGI